MIGGVSPLRWQLPAGVFAAGGVVMVLELVGPRLGAAAGDAGPRAWAAIIGATLLALAAGSWLGGRWADRAPHARHFFAILAAAAVLVAAVPFACGPLLRLSHVLGAGSGVPAVVVLLFVPLTLLGMAPPFAVRLAARELRSVGGIAGSMGATSTAGSLAGTLLAGFSPASEGAVPALLLGSAALLALLAASHAVAGRAPRTPALEGARNVPAAR